MNQTTTCYSLILFLLAGLKHRSQVTGYAFINVKLLAGEGAGGRGQAKAGDLNSDHLFSSNARPHGN